MRGHQPLVGWGGSYATHLVVDASGSGVTDGLTWTQDPTIALWRGKLWAMFDGNQSGGTSELAAGQIIMLKTSSDLGATWAAATHPFTDSAQCNNPLSSGMLALQANLLVINDVLWAFWQGSNDTYASKLTDPAGKWTNYRWQFDANGKPNLSSTLTGAADAGNTTRLSLDGVTDYWMFQPSIPAVLSDGTIAMAVTFQSQTVADPAVPSGANSFNKNMKFNAVLYSADQGATWTMSERIPPGPNITPGGHWEPFVVEGEDGAIRVFCRNIRWSGQPTLGSAQQVAVAYNRMAFMATKDADVQVPVSRGDARRVSTTRWTMAHCDYPDGTVGATPGGRFNGMLFASRRGENDFVPAIPFAYLLNNVVYPAHIIVGSQAYVIYTSDRSGRRNLYLAVVDIPTDDSTAYVYPRRLSEIAVTSGPTPFTGPPAGYRFNGNQQTTAATALTGPDETFTAWMQMDDPNGDGLLEEMAIEGRSGMANAKGNILTASLASFAGVNVRHGQMFSLGTPIFVAGTFNSATGKISVFYGAGGSSLIEVDGYVKTVTVGGVPANNEAVTIDGTVFTFKTTPSAGTDVQIGATVATTVTNLVAKLVANGRSATALGAQVAIARSDLATFSITASTNVTADTVMPFASTVAPVFGHSIAASFVPVLIGNLWEARCYNSVLSVAQLTGIYNGLAAVLGYAPMSGAAAIPTPAVLFDSTATTGGFPDLTMVPPTARISGTDLVFDGEASASVELPWEATEVQLRFKLGALPSGAERYVIATFGSVTNPVYLYIGGTHPTQLVRTGLAPSGWSGGGVDDLAVGDGVVRESEPEEGLEAGHRCAASVVTEDVLVEVDRQVLG